MKNKVTKKQIDLIISDIYENYSFEDNISEDSISEEELMITDISRTIQLIKKLSPFNNFKIHDEEELWDGMPLFILKVDLYVELLEEFKEEYRAKILNQSKFKTLGKWQTRHIKRANKIEKSEVIIKKRRM